MTNDVIRMQQEAEQRVRRMREQSRILVSGGLPETGRNASSMAAGRPPSSRPCPPPPRPAPPPEPEPCPPLAAAEKPGGLSGLFHDPDQLFLLLLAVLLIKNGAQTELILALLYLAL